MLRFDIDPVALDQAGWCIVFTQNTPVQAKEGLKALLSRRREQAGELYQEIQYQAGESVRRFRLRHGLGPGPVDPKNLPYYILLVGSPEEISFEFQYQLAVSHAVGRLYFDDPEDYAKYAAHLLAQENHRQPETNRAALIAPRHLGDPATAEVFRHFVEPLSRKLSQIDGRRIELRTDNQAEKSSLVETLTEEDLQLLFIATHGYRLSPNHPKQEAYQGALVCQDWPGEGHPVQQEHVLSAEDLVDPIAIKSRVLFLFSSDSAGTPKTDAFQRSETRPRTLAPRPFLSRLAQRLLAIGALSIIGHVDRIWSTSYRLREDGQESVEVTFHSILDQLLKGRPVGLAMGDMTSRYVELSIQLSELLLTENAEDSTRAMIANLWTAQIDARNYIVLGDPAFRL